VSEPEFVEILPKAEDIRQRRLISNDGVTAFVAGEQRMVTITAEALENLAYEAFKEVNFFLRSDHLAQLRTIFDDEEASSNDRVVALDLLKNANIASGGVLPMCQDTGTALVYARRGHRISTDGKDQEYLSRGIARAYRELNLRYSQLAPLTTWEEVNTGTNLPAEIDISFCEGDSYEFLFMAKGGGSANKSFLFQETRAILEEDRMLEFLRGKIEAIGPAACPPYHLAVVIGGTSADYALKTAKLASTRFLDNLPPRGNGLGSGMRDREFERKVFEMTQTLGFGAQFGGKYFCHDVRVVRLPRHGGSLPIAIAVSCSADRQILGRITSEGVFLEELEHEPSKFLPDFEAGETLPPNSSVSIDLNRPISEVRAELSNLSIGERVLLSGEIIVARDAAHAKWREMLEAGESLPDYTMDYPIYYAGPSKTPEGMPSGSFGPTTAGRMDSYVDLLQSRGASLITLAKGNRSSVVAQSCQEYGGFYLGTVGGPAALIAQDNIKKVELIDFPELGMEAVYRITVQNFPAFVVIDDKGNDFYSHGRKTGLKIGRRPDV
jgi:fumarate hydratase class I